MDSSNRSVRKVILYARFSPRPRPEDCDSITAQLSRCRAFAEMHGYEILGEYTDAGVSGKTSVRPGLEQAMNAACKSGAILVVYSLSRLARSTLDSIRLLEQLQKAGADLASLKEQFDSSTPVGKLVFRILASINEFERDQIAERTSDAMQSYQASGRRVSSNVPYGFELDPESEPHRRSGIPVGIRENEAEQRVIQSIRRLRESGQTLRGIARRLNSSGVPARGRQWDHKLIGRVLARSK